MKKQLLAYILSCIEEMPNDFDLGGEIRQLRDVLEKEVERQDDVLLKILMSYTIIYTNDYQLGEEIRNLYPELTHFFNECTGSINTNSN